MVCSMPGFPVLHQLPELAQTHVHPVGDATQSSHPLYSQSPPAFWGVVLLPLSLPPRPLGGREVPFFPGSGPSQEPSLKRSIPQEVMCWRSFCKLVSSANNQLAKSWMSYLKLWFSSECSPQLLFHLRRREFSSSQFIIFSIWGTWYPIRPVTLPWPDHHFLVTQLGCWLTEWQASTWWFLISWFYVKWPSPPWRWRESSWKRVLLTKEWCWRRLLRIPWTARRSNKSLLKEVNPEYSLDGLMLKLNL